MLATILLSHWWLLGAILQSIRWGTTWAGQVPIAGHSHTGTGKSQVRTASEDSLRTVQGADGDLL